MPKFKMNTDITYVKSALVEKNIFLSSPAEDVALPKYEEIAHHLGLPIGTVKSRIFFARKRLQAMLKDFRHYSE